MTDDLVEAYQDIGTLIENEELEIEKISELLKGWERMGPAEREKHLTPLGLGGQETSAVELERSCHDSKVRAQALKDAQEVVMRRLRP